MGKTVFILVNSLRRSHLHIDIYQITKPGSHFLHQSKTMQGRKLNYLIINCPSTELLKINCIYLKDWEIFGKNGATKLADLSLEIILEC